MSQNNNTFVFSCSCGTQLIAEHSQMGQQVMCAGCNRTIVVPTPTQPVPNPVPVQQAPSVPQPQPVPQPKPVPQPAPSQPFAPPAAPTNATVGKQVSGLGVTAGILAIVFSLVHLSCAGCLGVGTAMVANQAQNMKDFSDVPGKQSPIVEKHNKTVNRQIDSVFGYAMMGLGLTITLFVLYAISLIVGSIGLFRTSLWGWILANINALISLVTVCVIFYSYMQGLSGLNRMDKMIDKGNNVAEKAMSESSNEFRRDFDDMRREGMSWQRRQLHTSAWTTMIIYGGFGLITGLLLLNPHAFRQFTRR